LQIFTSVRQKQITPNVHTNTRHKTSIMEDDELKSYKGMA
jgi:hypothetical protein